MYYYLSQSLKRRLILELKDSFAGHPVYSKIVPFIQNKFSFEERPQYGIVVKGSSANKVSLSADNFIGVVQSHVMLAYVGQPAYPLEWVREDLACVQEHGCMPTPPGIYYIEVLRAPTAGGDPGFFALDPLYTVTSEPVLLFQSGVEREAQLQQIPLGGTLRLWENQRQLLNEGEDYEVDYSTGSVRLITSFNPSADLVADYRYVGTSRGPLEFKWNSSDTKTLPGVVLAFGKRSSEKDRVAVVVYQDRVEAAEAYGGKFEVSFDFDVIARDPTQMEEIADLVFMFLWGQKKSRLEYEGIEIIDISMGGEAEEIADESGEEFFYQASMSIQLRADWEIHLPRPLTISKATPVLQQITGSLYYATHPVIAGRNDNYERIG